MEYHATPRRPMSIGPGFNKVSTTVLEEAIDEVTHALDRFQTEGYAAPPPVPPQSERRKMTRRPSGSTRTPMASPPPSGPPPSRPLPPSPSVGSRPMVSHQMSTSVPTVSSSSLNRPILNSHISAPPPPLSSASLSPASVAQSPLSASLPHASPAPLLQSAAAAGQLHYPQQPATYQYLTPEQEQQLQHLQHLQQLQQLHQQHQQAYLQYQNQHGSPPRDATPAWPPLDAETIAYLNSHPEAIPRRPSSRAAAAAAQPPRKVSVSSSHASHNHRRSSSMASSGSYAGGANPFPAPSKPLPSVPPSMRSSQRVSSQLSSASEKSSSLDLDRFSQSSGTSSSLPDDRTSYQSQRQVAPVRPGRPDDVAVRQEMSPVATSEASPQPAEEMVDPEKPRLDVRYWKQLEVDSRKVGPVRYLDVSGPSTTVATKHGNNQIRFWSVGTETVQGIIKFSSYTEARCRSRDYLIRSHVVLSEAAKLAAVATRFGRTIEIWNWVNKKRLQVIDDADRWAAGRFETYDAGWSPLAAYRGDTSVIDLYAATRNKKPFAKVRTIDLAKANLPLIPQYPELALSPTSPLLVLASGPRTPRAGHPPPERETLLVAWEIHDYRDVSNSPFRVIRPWQHRELDTSLPCSLATYDSLVVSLWIPASHKTVTMQNARGGQEHSLAPVAVPFRYVLVWDLAENSTRTYGIPNTTSCISPDCRFVAYSKVAEKRSKLAVLDALTGDELWSVGGEGNLHSLDKFGGDLAKVTDLTFSSDGQLLLVGDSDGHTSIYNVQQKIQGASSSSGGRGQGNSYGSKW